MAEREENAILHAAGHAVRAIAKAIGRSPSTISRELRRNAATRGGTLDYRASVAHWKADVRSPTQGRQARGQRSVTALRRGAPFGQDHPAGRRCCRRTTRTAMERLEQAPSTATADV
ncbi:hypothetical protein CVN56_27030 [Rhodococcus sp. AQ5-07]|nr:hypothetical protein CVN56_27030 [Rhodococcus sp. AQ5-07]